jgi:SAM-dependent methyltransferase
LISSLSEKHLREVSRFYDADTSELPWTARHYRRLLGHYYRLLIPEGSRVLEVGCGGADLLALLPGREITGVDISERQIGKARVRAPHGRFFSMAAEDFCLEETFDFIIISESVNLFADAQQVFENLRRVSHSGTRLILNFHSRLWHPVLRLAEMLGLASHHPAWSWFNWQDLSNLLWLSGWQTIRRDARILVPFPLLGLDRLVNRWLAPVFQWFCLTIFLVSRPVELAVRREYSVSVVIPARNEAGNIEAAIQRTPELGNSIEFIFIEGHSQDNTWEEILRVQRAYPHKNIKAMRQTGKGKGNAVREAFEQASGDILMILDADLTMPPEDLPKFYQVLAGNRAEFANGVRLVYPIEERAMQFVNLLANRVFGLLFTWLIGQAVKDTLCGTKALFRDAYRVLSANRAYFGDFDPFGDFDLLFGASRMNLKIADVPIRYRERTYGSTNIQRWRHGALLLRMVLFAAAKLRFV